MSGTQVRSMLYLALAVLGLVGTWYFNIQWFDGDFEHTVDGFVEAAFANSASSSLSVDLSVAFFAGSAFMLAEGRRAGVRHAWAYVLGSAVIAFAFAFPLFLWQRERSLAATAPS